MSTTKKAIITLLALLVVSTALAGENLPKEIRYRLKELCQKKIETVNLYLDLCDEYSMSKVGELEKLFTIEDYKCEEQALELYYPERFLNIVEQRALVQRIENAENYTACRITTSSVYIIQCCRSQQIGIAQVEGESMSESQFQLSWENCGMPNDGGLGVL